MMESDVEIVRFELGPLQTNCYLIVHKAARKAVIIDPALHTKAIELKLSQHQCILERILLTHAHFDHIGGVNQLLDLYDPELCVHADDAEMLGNPELNFSLFAGTPYAVYTRLDEKTNLVLGGITIKIFHTPGHTQGSLSFYTEGHVFVGDVLFRNSVGRTDFPGASHDTLIDSIHKKLLRLPDETHVYPGHGLETTIGRERTENVFLVGNQSYI